MYLGTFSRRTARLRHNRSRYGVPYQPAASYRTGGQHICNFYQNSRSGRNG